MAAAAGAGAQASTDAQTGDQGTTAKTGEQRTGTGTEQQQQQSATTGEEQQGAKTGTADAQQGAKKAPERYEFTIPDEHKAFFSKKALERVESIARSNDWTNDEANAEIADMAAFESERRKELVSGFETELKANTRFGGDNLVETQRLGNLAIAKIRADLGDELTDRFLGILKTSGYGSELSVAAVLATIGKLAAEDMPPRGQSAGGRTSESVADKLYDNPTSQRAQEAAAKQ